MTEKQFRAVVREELGRNEVPKLYDTRATAKMLGLSTGGLCNWRVVGKGPKPTSVGGKIMYRLTEINESLDNNTTSWR